MANKRKFKTEKQKQNINMIGGLIFLLVFIGVYFIGYQFRPPAGNDFYRDMRELLQKEPASSYELNTRKVESPILIIAPHGGKIEQFTASIGNGIAGSSFNFFEFRGLLEKGSHAQLHVSSSNYNPPQLDPLNRTAEVTLSIHGLSGKEKVTYVGGRDLLGAQMVREALMAEGFAVETASVNYNGNDINNFVNRNRRRQGIQLEISLGQRQALFTKRNEERPNEDYDRYVGAIKGALEALADSATLKK